MRKKIGSDPELKNFLSDKLATYAHPAVIIYNTLGLENISKNCTMITMARGG